VIGYLSSAPVSAAAQRLFDEDVADVGYVMNVSRLWAYQPELLAALFDLGRTATADRFDMRQRAILVSACAAAAGDSYCALAWGARLAARAGADTAAGVLAGDDTGLTAAEQAMAAWTRTVVRGAGETTPADLDALHAAGFTDEDIFAMTAFVGIRLAIMVVNDALGLPPDAELHDGAPRAVRDAVTFGRPAVLVTSSE
jgi:alkylhydroperoxidase family enzyme